MAKTDPKAAARAAKEANVASTVYFALKESACAVMAKHYGAKAHRFDPKWSPAFLEGLAEKDGIFAIGVASRGGNVDKVSAAIALLHEHCHSLVLEIWPGEILEDAIYETDDGRCVPVIRVEIDDSNVEKFSTAKSVFDLVLTASDLQKKELPKLVCIVEDVIPEGLTLFAAKPKWGKSWSALDLGHAVASGGTFLGKQCKQGDVLYLALEDSERRMQDRLVKVAGNAPWPVNMQIVTIDKKFPTLDQGGLDLIREWVANVANPRLILIDTLKKVRPHEDKNRKAYDCDYEALEALHEFVASVPGLACIVYHHARKAAAEDIFDEFSGSLGLTAVPDHLLIGARAAGNVKQKEVHARGRDLPEFSYAIQLDEETGFRIKVLGEIAEAKRNANEVAIEEVLRENGEPMHLDEIKDALAARGVRLTKDNVKQICSRMYKANRIAREGGGRYSLGSDGGAVLWPVVPISELKVNGKWQPVMVKGNWAFVEEPREGNNGWYMKAALQGDGAAVDVMFKDKALRLVHGVVRGREATVRGRLNPNDLNGKLILVQSVEGIEPGEFRPSTEDDGDEKPF